MKNILFCMSLCLSLSGAYGLQFRDRACLEEAIRGYAEYEEKYPHYRAIFSLEVGVDIKQPLPGGRMQLSCNYLTGVMVSPGWLLTVAHGLLDVARLGVTPEKKYHTDDMAHLWYPPVISHPSFKVRPLIPGEIPCVGERGLKEKNLACSGIDLALVNLQKRQDLLLQRHFLMPQEDWPMKNIFDAMVVSGNQKLGGLEPRYKAIGKALNVYYDKDASQPLQMKMPYEKEKSFSFQDPLHFFGEKGDTGSPLIISNEGRPMVLGLLSGSDFPEYSDGSIPRRPITTYFEPVCTPNVVEWVYKVINGA